MRSEILSHTTRRYSDVDIPGVGNVRIRSLTEAERNAIELKQLDKHGRRDLKKLPYTKVNWIIACAVDEHGACLFADADADRLLLVDSYITDTLFDAIQDHVGLSAKDREALLKNSQETDGDDSPTV